MSLLEDRLVRILELRKLDKDDGEIASALELSPDIVRDYEIRIGDEIRKYPHNSSALLGNDLGVSISEINSWEQGRITNINKNNLKALDKLRKTPLEKPKRKLLTRRGRRGPPSIEEKYADRIPALCEAILGGFSTQEEFENHTGLKYSQIEKIAKKLKIELPDFKNLKAQDDVRKIQGLLDYGFSMASEISELTEINQCSISKYQKEGLIKFPKDRTSTKSSRALKYGRIVEHRDLIDRMIEDGASQADIARKIEEISHEKISRENIRQYIEKSDQYGKWKSAKSQPEIIRNNEKIVEQDLVNTLYNISLDKSKEEGYREALEYYLNKGNRSTTRLKKLIKLVRAYKSAQQKGEKVSYEKLANISKLKHSVSVTKYLKNMGFKSFNWTRRYLTPLQKNSINKIYKLGLNSKDISYFLDTNHATVSKVIKRSRVGAIERQRGIQELSGLKGLYYLSYRGASQIYGFSDEMKATPEKIAEALDKSVEVVECALKYRNKIEPKLTSALRVLFPHERISKPYR